MRKYIALLFCTFIMLSLLSCNESPKAAMDTTSSESTVLDDSAPKEEQTNAPQETTTDPQETPAPEETEPAMLESIYRSVLQGKEQVFIEAIGEHGYLENYIPTGAEISLAKCDILRYTYYDVDGDDIKDVAIDCGSEKLYLTYENGTVTLKTLSAEIWEKIEAEDYWYLINIGFAPLAMFFRPSKTIASAKTHAVVVPSPALSLVFMLTSLIKLAPMFSKGFSSSISRAIETPSLVISGVAYFRSRTTFFPFGPRVIFTASATAFMPFFNRFLASSPDFICLAISQSPL